MADLALRDLRFYRPWVRADSMHRACVLLLHYSYIYSYSYYYNKLREFATSGPSNPPPD